RPVEVCAVATGEPIRQFEADSQGATGLAVSHDGTFLLLTRGSPVEGLEVWDVAMGKWRRRLFDRWPVVGMRLTPDDKVAYTRFPRTGEDGSFTWAIWDLETGEMTRYGSHDDSWQCPLALSPDGRLAISEKWDRGPGKKDCLVLWDTLTRK